MQLLNFFRNRLLVKCILISLSGFLIYQYMNYNEKYVDEVLNTNVINLYENDEEIQTVKINNENVESYTIKYDNLKNFTIDGENLKKFTANHSDMKNVSIHDENTKNTTIKKEKTFNCSCEPFYKDWTSPIMKVKKLLELRKYDTEIIAKEIRYSVFKKTLLEVQSLKSCSLVETDLHEVKGNLKPQSLMVENTEIQEVSKVGRYAARWHSA